MSQLLTIEQVAGILGCKPAAIRKWIYQRRLTPVKLGRLTRLRSDDIEAVATKGLPVPGKAVQPVRRPPRSRQVPRSAPERPPSAGTVREGTAEAVPAPT